MVAIKTATRAGPVIVDQKIMTTTKIYGAILIMLTVFFAVCIVSLIVYSNKLPATRVYDCGMAEWHPDIPQVVKEECRKRYKGVTV